MYLFVLFVMSFSLCLYIYICVFIEREREKDGERNGNTYKIPAAGGHFVQNVAYVKIYVYMDIYIYIYTYIYVCIIHTLHTYVLYVFSRNYMQF